MKAIVARDYGPLENLEYADWPDPQAGPGEVVIDEQSAIDGDLAVGDTATTTCVRCDRNLGHLPRFARRRLRTAG